MDKIKYWIERNRFNLFLAMIFIPSLLLSVIYGEYMGFFLYALVYGLVIYLNKENYDSLPNPKSWEVIFGFVVIIVAFLSTPIKWIFFPETRIFGVFNYYLFLVGVTFLFYPITNFKKIYGPMILLGALVFINSFWPMGNLLALSEKYISPSLASLTAWFLGPFYPSIYAEGITIFTSSGSLEIAGSCSGINSVVLYGFIASALVAGIKSTIPRKIVCIIGGIGGAFLINIARINILVIALNNGRESFDFIHGWIGYALFTIFVGVYWWLSFRCILEEHKKENHLEE